MHILNTTDYEISKSRVMNTKNLLFIRINASTESYRITKEIRKT